MNWINRIGSMVDARFLMRYIHGMRSTQEESTVAAPIMHLTLGLGPIQGSDQIGVQVHSRLDTEEIERLYDSLQGDGQAFVNALTSIASGGADAACETITSYLVQVGSIAPEHHAAAAGSLLKAAYSRHVENPDDDPCSSPIIKASPTPLHLRVIVALRVLFNRV